MKPKKSRQKMHVKIMYDVEKLKSAPITKREYREYLIGLISITVNMKDINNDYIPSDILCNRTLLFEAMKELYRIDSEDGD